MTDAQKVLHELQIAGNKGCHSFTLIHSCHTTRIAARINDLKKQGYKITSTPERMGNSIGCRYFLNEEKKKEGKWDFSSGKARWITEEVEQEHLF